MNDLRIALFVTVGSLIASFFSYLLQFYLGRNLSVGDYGLFNALLSFAAIVGVPITVFATSLVKKVSALAAQNQADKLASLYWKSLELCLLAGIALLLVFGISENFIAATLKVTQNSVLYAFVISVALSFVWNIPYVYLQGTLKYFWFTAFVIVSAMLRFFLPLTLLYFGITLHRIFLLTGLGVLLTTLFATLGLKRYLFGFKHVSVKDELIYILKFSWPVMLSNLCLMSFINTDVLVIRTYMSPEVSGLYAGAVTLGKILLFGSTSVALVMFPKISALYSAGKPFSKSFRSFFVIQALIVTFGLITFLIFPKYIALVFFGDRFLESVKYLQIYSIFIYLYVFLNFFNLFLLAVEYTKYYLLLAGITFVQLVLLYTFHASINQVVSINIILAIIGCGFGFFKSKRLLN